MQNVKVNRLELLAILKKNMAGHQIIFEEAIDGYRKQIIKELEVMLDDAVRGKRIRRVVSLAEPVNQLKDYERAIRMLEMSVDDVVVLQEHEFENYVMNRWNWTQKFLHTNSHYSVSAGQTLAGESPEPEAVQMQSWAEGIHQRATGQTD